MHDQAVKEQKKERKAPGILLSTFFCRAYINQNNREYGVCHNEQPYRVAICKYAVVVWVLYERIIN